MKRDFSDFIAIDIGNSRIKLLYSDEMTTFDIKENWQGEIKDYLSGVFQFAIQTLSINSLNVCISSVNDGIDMELRKILDSFHIQVVSADDVLNLQKVVDFSLVSGMGSDRKLGLIGALEYEKVPLISVDIGTAVTINVLDKNSICRGGVIFPGPYTQVKSLSHSASGLNEVNLTVAAEVNGLDTLSAISNGIIYGICGGIKEIIELIKMQNPDMKKAKIIMTGGGAKLVKWIMSVLDFDFRYEEDLVLRGILKIMRTKNLESNLDVGLKERDEVE